MKKYFITGLIILLPLAVTIGVAMFLINLLTDPFVGIVKSIFAYYDILESGFLFLSASQLQQIASQVLVLLFLFFFTVLLGTIARWFLIHSLLRLWDYLIHRIPLVRSIYKTCQDVINTVLQGNNKSFKQVVLVPFPTSESQSVGLVTREDVKGLGKDSDSSLVAVFIPTTPNPTSGFLIFFEEKDLVYLDISIEEALKYVISCGLILNRPFKPISKKEAAILSTQNVQNNDEE